MTNIETERKAFQDRAAQLAELTLAAGFVRTCMGGNLEADVFTFPSKNEVVLSYGETTDGSTLTCLVATFYDRSGDVTDSVEQDEAEGETDAEFLGRVMGMMACAVGRSFRDLQALSAAWIGHENEGVEIAELETLLQSYADAFAEAQS